MKVGFLHIPKCAGTSLAAALYNAYGQKRQHISAIRDPGMPLQRHSIERGSEAFQEMRTLPFLSGHLSFSHLRELDRGIIFTTLRDPRTRLFSLYTYAQSRAQNPIITERRPELKAARDQTFADYLSSIRPNGISRLLFFDVPRLKHLHLLPLERAEEVTCDCQRLADIDMALARFDLILAGPDSSISKGLSLLLPNRAIDIERLNESDKSLSLKLGCCENEFDMLLERHTWLDSVVCKRAARLFPDHIDSTGWSADAQTTRAALEKRYQLVFS